LPLGRLLDAQGFGNAPPKFLIRFVSPRKDWYIFLSKRSCHLVLSGVNVAGDPSDLSAQSDESLDENGGLSGDVGTSGYFGAHQGLVSFGSAPKRHQSGHFLFGYFDFFPTKLPVIDVFDAKVGKVVFVALLLLSRTEIVFDFGALVCYLNSSK
jgi:hypothetical protein